MPTVSPKYKITEQKTKLPRFLLELDGQEIASLTLENKHASRATVSLRDKQVVIHRQRGIKKDLVLHAPKGDVQLGRFVANLLSRGVLTLGQSQFRWAPAKNSWLSWAWYDEKGNEVLRIQKKLHLFKTNAHVYSQDKLNEETEALLSLLGLQLLHISQSGGAGHLKTALDVSREKYGKKIPQKNYA